MPKNWAKGLTKETDARIARAAEGHRGLRYVRRSAVDRRRGPGCRVDLLCWTPALAYAVGLAATDGCLISTGRHVAFVSTDRDLMETFLRCIGRDPSKSGIRKDGNAYRAQFGDVELYRWLSATGLTQRKSLTLGSVEVPLTSSWILFAACSTATARFRTTCIGPCCGSTHDICIDDSPCSFTQRAQSICAGFRKGWLRCSRSRAPLFSSRRTENRTCTRCSTRSTHQSRYSPGSMRTPRARGSFVNG